MQAQAHLATVIEVDPQLGFFAAGELSPDAGGLLSKTATRSYLHFQKMSSGGDLHGMEFMALDLVEHDQVSLFYSFQCMRIGQQIIDPDGLMSVDEFVVYLDFQQCRSGSRT